MGVLTDNREKNYTSGLRTSLLEIYAIGIMNLIDISGFGTVSAAARSRIDTISCSRLLQTTVRVSRDEYRQDFQIG